MGKWMGRKGWVKISEMGQAVVSRINLLRKKERKIQWDWKKEKGGRGKKKEIGGREEIKIRRGEKT